jgi:hypothetical protein
VRRLLLTVGLCALLVLNASAAEITIVSGNVESGEPIPRRAVRPVRPDIEWVVI